MHVSDKGISIIKEFEGCELTAYRCPAGVLTIGYGHTARVTANQTITLAEAENLLKCDLIKFEGYVKKYVPFSLNQNQFDALVSFTYNCGVGCLQTLVKNRNAAQVAEALLLYNKANGKKLDGLVRRRKAERALFLSEDVTTTPKAESELPYEVITTSDLNIREGAGVSFPKIRVAPKGSKLKVWAIETNGDTKWGKNGKEYFCLGYTKKI